MCNVEGPPLRAKVPARLVGTDPLPIYLDHNATTPVCPEAWSAMMGCQHVWGNPSSTHPYGLDAKFVMERCREEVACALDVKGARALFDRNFGNAFSTKIGIGQKRQRGDNESGEGSDLQSRRLDLSEDAKSIRHSIVFTACGTECNNLAIHGTIHTQKSQHGRSIIVTSNVEHPATAKAMDMLEVGCLNNGFQILRVPVDATTGSIHPNTFKSMVAPVINRVALVTVMHANNETGSIQPIKDLVAVIKELESTSATNGGRCYFHVDAAQSLGKIPFSVDDLGVDLVSVVGHKFYGPKGVGALYCHKDITLRRIIEGADHESGRRPGTENIILIAGMAKALYIAMSTVEVSAAHMRLCRETLLDEINRQCGGKTGSISSNTDSRKDTHKVGAKFEVVVNGMSDFSNCLPNTLNIAIREIASQTYISGNRLLDEVGLKVAASAGSACHSVNGDDKPITVSLPLQAIGVPLERAMGTLRLSTGKMNTVEEMTRAGRIIGKAAVQQFADW